MMKNATPYAAITTRESIGNDQPSAADRMHSVEYVSGMAPMIYCNPTGKDDTENTVPQRKVIGTTMTLVNIMIVVRLFERKPTSTPRRE